MDGTKGENAMLIPTISILLVLAVVVVWAIIFSAEDLPYDENKCWNCNKGSCEGCEVKE